LDHPKEMAVSGHPIYWQYGHPDCERNWTL